MMVVNEKQLFKILELPRHLQITIVALLKLGLATAAEVAGSTGKARAVESSYLNQLVVLRVAHKERKGHKAFFSVDLEALGW